MNPNSSVGVTDVVNPYLGLNHGSLIRAQSVPTIEKDAKVVSFNPQIFSTVNQPSQKDALVCSKVPRPARPCTRHSMVGLTRLSDEASR